METWTKDDERWLAEAAARKQRVMEAHKRAVESVANDFFYRDMRIDEVVDALIANADRITQVLEPFTSKPEAE